MKKYGNPQIKSRFICIKCGKENMVGDGIQRENQRKRYHVKDLYCINCCGTTKNVEIRYCDSYTEIVEKVPALREKYY